MASSTSPELIAFLSALQTHLSFLRRTLSPTVFRRCFRSVANSLQTYLWDYVIARNTFSFAGGSQFARDMNEVWRVFGDGGEATMGRVAEACVLLALPVEGDSEKTLRGVVKPAFEDNAKARECMAKLGIKELAVGDVRGVLQRRVEAFGS